MSWGARSSSRQRGVLNLAHTPQEIRDGRRRVQANLLAGVDAQWLEPAEVAEDLSDPECLAAIALSGVGRHLPAAGGHRQARLRGMGLRPGGDRPWRGHRRALRGDRVRAPERSGDRACAPRGAISARRRWPSARPATRVCSPTWSGCRCPYRAMPLQALVSELLRPVHPTVVMSNAVHVYVSQAHKGELVMGAGIDAHNSYSQRGAMHIIERQLAAAVELFPVFARAHVLRTWGGIVDVSPDASPIVGLTGIDGLMINCGWGTGGFKATPGIGWCYAHTIAHGRAPSAQRPVHIGPFHHRCAGRRARRRRRGALTEGRHDAHHVSLVRSAQRDRVPLRRRRRAWRTRPTRRPSVTRSGAGFCSCGPTPRASSTNAGVTAPAAGAGSACTGIRSRTR